MSLSGREPFSLFLLAKRREREKSSDEGENILEEKSKLSFLVIVHDRICDIRMPFVILLFTPPPMEP